MKKFSELTKIEQTIHEAAYSRIDEIQASVMADIFNIVTMGGNLNVAPQYLLEKFTKEAARALIGAHYTDITNNNKDITIDEAYNTAVNITSDYIQTAFNDPKTRKSFHEVEARMTKMYNKTMKAQS